MRPVHPSGSAPATRTLVGAVGVSPAGLSPGRGDYRRFCFRRRLHHAFPFRGHFAPPALTGFIATMDPLTPARLSPPRRSPHLSRAPFRSFPLHPHPGIHASSVGSPWTVACSPLARQASPLTSRLALSDMPYRVHSRSGPTFRLGLLPTPSCDDAVAFDCLALFACAKDTTFTFRVHGFIDALGRELDRAPAQAPPVLLEAHHRPRRPRA